MQLNSNKDKILEFINDNRFLTYEILINKFNVSRTYIDTIMQPFIDKKFFIKGSRGRNVVFIQSPSNRRKFTRNWAIENKKRGIKNDEGVFFDFSDELGKENNILLWIVLNTKEKKDFKFTKKDLVKNFNITNRYANGIVKDNMQFLEYVGREKMNVFYRFNEKTFDELEKKTPDTIEKYRQITSDLLL